GIRIVSFGKFDGSYREVEELLKNVGIKNAVVKIYGDASMEDLEETILRESIYKKTLIVLNKVDLVDYETVREVGKAVRDLDVPFLHISVEKKINIEILKSKIFQTLDLIRVYTQKDGVVSPRPVILKVNSTVRDLAEKIHKEIAEKLRYARVWGRSVKIQGQQVGPGHVLQDGDVIELYSD
ncbi:MAG: TGS domain-containing protein, partial [Nitrososphaerota archaeon]